MTTPAAPTRAIDGRVWTDPLDGRRYLIVGENMLGGLEPLEGWRYAAPGRCVVCDRWTRAHNPKGQSCHPACAQSEGTAP